MEHCVDLTGIMNEKDRSPIETTAYVGEKSIHFHVIPRIDLYSSMEFVESVVVSCIDEEGDYLPQIKDFAIRTGLIEYYTDLILPDDVDEQYDIVYGTLLYDLILSQIDTTQFAILVDACDERIKFQVDSMLAVAAKRVNEVMAELERIALRSDELFDKVDTMSAGLGKIGDMDEESLVKTIIDLSGQKPATPKKAKSSGKKRNKKSDKKSDKVLHFSDES